MRRCDTLQFPVLNVVGGAMREVRHSNVMTTVGIYVKTVSTYSTGRNAVAEGTSCARWAPVPALSPKPAFDSWVVSIVYPRSGGPENLPRPARIRGRQPRIQRHVLSIGSYCALNWALPFGSRITLGPPRSYPTRRCFCS